MDPEEQELLHDYRYKNYSSGIEKALRNFESSSEWADLISSLGKLNKVCGRSAFRLRGGGTLLSFYFPKGLSYSCTTVNQSAHIPPSSFFPEHSIGVDISRRASLFSTMKLPNQLLKDGLFSLYCLGLTWLFLLRFTFK